MTSNIQNVILITLDQWRFEAIGTRTPIIPTPNLNKFSEKSADFLHHYAVTCPCAPSRASILTGLYAHSHRVIHNGTPLANHIETLGQAARRANRWPVLIGYTDTTPDPRFRSRHDPVYRSYQGVIAGFDAMLIYEDFSMEWMETLRDKGINIGKTPQEAFAPTPKEIAENPDKFYCQHPARYNAEDSFVAFYTDKARRFLNSHMARDPFLLHLTYLPPHPPYIAPAPYNSLIDPNKLAEPVRQKSLQQEKAIHPFVEAMLTHCPSANMLSGDKRTITQMSTTEIKAIKAIYYGMIAEVDTQLGRLFKAIENNNLFDNTMIIITSDHGDLLGDHYAQGKQGYWSQNYHVPMLLYHPSIRKNTKIKTITETIDIMPTILKAIGAETPHACQGYDMLPLIRKTQRKLRQYAHQHYNFVRPSAQDKPMPAMLGLDYTQAAMDIISDDEYKYVHFSDLPPLLFDLKADPHCFVNLAAKKSHMSTLNKYLHALMSFRQHTDDKTLTHYLSGYPSGDKKQKGLYAHKN